MKKDTDCTSCKYFSVTDDDWCYCSKEEKILLRVIGHNFKTCKSYKEKEKEKQNENRFK